MLRFGQGNCYSLPSASQGLEGNPRTVTHLAGISWMCRNDWGWSSQGSPARSQQHLIGRTVG